MRVRLHPLDRYVLREFLGIFAAAAVGFPVLVIVLDVTENLGKYLQRELPPLDIVKAYVFGVPETMFLVLPAAVLFATVFSIGGFTRHSEITAAKASGISFHRFIVPIAFGALASTGLGLALAAVMPDANRMRDQLLQERKSRNMDFRASFTFASEDARVYKIGQADAVQGTMDDVEIDRRGTGPAYPSYVIYARNARHSSGAWTLKQGVMHLMPGDSTTFTIAFDSLRDAHFRESPRVLMADPRAPEEMGFHDLGVFIRQMERSGTDVNKFRTARMLKLAIPATCVIIMLFGAPLATSTQRGGAALGVGISLATTVVFLMLVQLTLAVGEKGLVLPELAAWIPCAVFGSLGAVLLAKVRT
ncbi:MAG: LptF/LptG family permease [Gemmatimonadota bacterium]|nr:LptF/LptG family permease [Gemmatimonadota bacterium]